MQAAATTALLLLAVFYTLYFARQVILPVVIAVLLSLILWPLVRALKHLRVPEALGALVVLGGLAAAIAWTCLELVGPASEWMQSAPQTMRRIETRLRVVKEAFADMRHATDQVEKLANVTEPTPAVVAVQGPHLGDVLLKGTWNTVAAGGMVIALTYFLLAAGDLPLRKIIAAMPTLADKKRIVAMSRETQDAISAYLGTVSLINGGLGVAVGTGLFMLGMPNPMLWGAMATVLNFVPYVGAATGIGIVGAVALVTFDRLGDALLPPAFYLVCTLIEGAFVTPLILSRRFTLNPVVVLTGLLFWSLIWGIPGALLAVPLLVTARIVCAYVPSLRLVGDLLGQ